MVSLDVVQGLPPRFVAYPLGVLMNQRILPTGQCWCGCGQEATRGAFFLSGHDKKAESAIILVEYGGVPEFLAKHGYAPGGKNPIGEMKQWRERGKSISSKKKKEDSEN